MGKVLSQSFRAAVAAAGMSLIAAPAMAQTFTRIADTTTKTADGSTLFAFGPPQLTGDTVVFAARSLKQTEFLYAASVNGGALVKLVDSNTLVPGGTGKFTGNNFGYLTAFQPNPSACSGPVVGTTAVAFVGEDAAGHHGIYSVPLTGGPVTKVVDWKTAVPNGTNIGQKLFSKTYDFCNISLSGTTIVFDAGQAGIYSVETNGKDLVKIDDSSHKIGKIFPIDQYLQPWISGDRVVYVGGNVFGPQAIYSGGTKTFGAQIVTSSTARFAFSYPNLTNTTIMFYAQPNDTDFQYFVLSATGAELTNVFQTNTAKVPAGTRGDVFVPVGGDLYSRFSTNGRRHMFWAETATKPPKAYTTFTGAFSVCRPNLVLPGVLSKLVQTGDLLNKAGTVMARDVRNLSQVIASTVGETTVDRFAAYLTASAPVKNPDITSGAPAIYVVTLPHC